MKEKAGSLDEIIQLTRTNITVTFIMASNSNHCVTLSITTNDQQHKKNLLNQLGRMIHIVTVHMSTGKVKITQGK